MIRTLTVRPHKKPPISRIQASPFTGPKSSPITQVTPLASHWTPLLMTDTGTRLYDTSLRAPLWTPFGSDWSTPITTSLPTYRTYLMHGSELSHESPGCLASAAGDDSSNFPGRRTSSDPPEAIFSFGRARSGPCGHALWLSTGIYGALLLTVLVLPSSEPSSRPVIHLRPNKVYVHMSDHLS